MLGDVITEFGSVSHTTFSSLQDIGTVVQHSQGVSQGVRGIGGQHSWG